MNSNYKNSKEVAKDIRDKIVELKPFDTLGVFVLCAFLSFPYFFVGAMSLALIDLIFEMMKLDVSLLNWIEDIDNSSSFFVGYLMIMVFGAFIWFIFSELNEKYGKKY